MKGIRWLALALVVTTFAVVASVYAYKEYTKPPCREGFVASYTSQNGWLCIGGYRPEDD